VKPKSRTRQNNALKHGAFAAEISIFDEDRSEFETLHKQLVEEFQPSGRMEEDIVLEIAKLRWCKLRIEHLYVHEAYSLRSHPAQKDMEKLATIFNAVHMGTPCDLVWQKAKELPTELFDLLKAYVKAPTKEVDDEWIEWFKKSAHYVYWTSHALFSEQCKAPSFLGETAPKLMELSAKRIAIEERLDAMIDRALKRLAQLKTYKEVLAIKGQGRAAQISPN
jgi:hypothetical protein